MSRMMRETVARVSDATGVPVREIMGRDRHKAVSQARQHAFRLLADQGKSLPAIGAYFDRDHTTVLHGVRRDRERNP